MPCVMGGAPCFLPFLHVGVVAPHPCVQTGNTGQHTKGALQAWEWRGQKGGSVVSHMAAHPCGSPPAGEAHMIGDGSVCPQLCTGPLEGPQMRDRAHVLRTGAQGWASPFPCTQAVWQAPLSLPAGVPHKRGSPGNGNGPPSPCLHACTKACMSGEMWGGACQVAYERWGVQGWCTWTGCTWHMKGEVQDWCMQAGCTGSCR
ncbi:hypothetical protein V8E53_005635 [Lactarius tabidus]